MSNLDTRPRVSALYSKTIEVRWADCDANQHLRHSAYADLCAHTRLGFMSQIGLTQARFKAQSIGPVLFKEETEYRREAHVGEHLTISVELAGSTGSTKSVQLSQRVYKENGELSAIHRATLGWMDLEKRKIIMLPEEIASLLITEKTAEETA